MAGAEAPISHAAVAEQREAEPQRSRVVFYGFPHHELNLEAVPHIIGAFRAGLERQPRTATLFLETHYLPESNARHWEQLVIALGGLENLRIAQLLAEDTHKLPDREEIEAKRRALLNADYIDLVTSQALPAKYAEPLYLGREVDALRKSHAFDVAFESHPPQVARTLEGMQTGSNELRSAAFNSFMEKDFEGLMQNWRSHIQLEHMIKSTRHGFNLADIRRRLSAGGEGSFIFVLAGTTHLALADQLKAGLPEGDLTEVEAASFTPYADITEYKLYDALSRGEEPEDIWYAQDFIEGIFGMDVLNRMDESLDNKEAMKRFAQNFEKISQATQRMAKSLSLDEIREMCLDQDKVYAYVDQSPHSETLRTVFTEPQQVAVRPTRTRATQEVLAGIQGDDPLLPFIESKTISQRDAQMIDWHFRGKMTFEQVAERLSLSHNTVRQYTYNAIGKLPEEVKRQLRGY